MQPHLHIYPLAYPHKVMLLRGEPPAGLRHAQDDASVPGGQDVLHAGVQLLLEPRVELGLVFAGGEQLLYDVVAGGVQRQGE